LRDVREDFLLTKTMLQQSDGQRSPSDWFLVRGSFWSTHMAENLVPELFRCRQQRIQAADASVAEARFYSPCKDLERAKLNRERWSAVSTFWEEPETK